MGGKVEIVRQLGERALLLPGLLAEALAANERLKARLSLLQEAAAHAQHPERAAASLEAERSASGLDDARFDETVSGARTLTDGALLVPGAGALLAGLSTDLAAMLEPLNAVEAPEAGVLQRRLAALAGTLPAAPQDRLAAAEIEAMTGARANGTDSVHRLIMDAHRAVNRVAAGAAVESIDGARVYNIEARDRTRIQAFMAGVNRTAALAFGHPGLATTATQVGGRLTIQNDVGATEAHVLIVHVEDRSVTITYTDVHRRRTRFFTSLLQPHGVTWGQPGEQPSGALKSQAFYLLTGRFTADDDTRLDEFLTLLGSSIVFLIDWNKARKALEAFVPRQTAVGILTWAAEHACGHRAFLVLGGAELVFDAIRRMPAGRVPYGARLDTVLGTIECDRFLRRVLRQASDGLRAQRSVRLIRDEIQADLARLFDTAESSVLTVLVRHLGITRMLAGAIAQQLAEGTAGAPSTGAQLALDAKRMEEKADRLTLQAREICARIRHVEALRQVVDEVENSTDALDECAFLLSLTQRRAGAPPALGELAGIVIDSVTHLVRAAEAASRLPEGRSVDAADALQEIDAVVLDERRADVSGREAVGGLAAAPCGDARELVLGLELARSLEGATDRLAHAALSLRDRVLGELAA